MLIGPFTLMAVAAGWGLAEATLFFVVPDVALTAIAVWRRSLRLSLLAGLSAALGAAVGGAIMWQAGAADGLVGLAGRRGIDGSTAAGLQASGGELSALLDRVPAVSSEMIANVHRWMGDPLWPVSLLIGAVTGQPYKVFAAAAGAQGLPLGLFLVVSVLARFARFALAVALAHIIVLALDRAGLGRTQQMAVLAGFWVLFYAVFWSVMPE